MSAITQLDIYHEADDFPALPTSGIPGGTTGVELRQIASYLKALASGAKGGTKVVRTGHLASPASGTFTLVSATAGQTAYVNGVPFMATTAAGVVGGNTWATGVSDTVDAAALAAAINASTNPAIAGVVTATSALGVVTVTAKQPGPSGNNVELAAGSTLATGTITLNNTVSTKTAAVGGVVRASTTVTVTSTAHGFSANRVVYCNSSDPRFPSGWKTIATAATDSFTYTETEAAATSTSAITYTSSTAGVGCVVTTGLLLSSNVVTATTSAAHGFTSGQTVDLVTAPTGFTTGKKVITVTGATTFTYSQTHADIASNDVPAVFVMVAVPSIAGTAVTGVTWQGPSDTTAAAAIATAINANATVAAVAYAYSAAGVVTIVSKVPSIGGNTLLLSVVGFHATASGARLTGGAIAGTRAAQTVVISGADGGTYTTTINGVAVTATGTNGNDTTTAASIATAINASTNALVRNQVTATSASGTVTITAVEPGIAGNKMTLAATGTGATATGATLAAGAAPTTIVASAAALTGGTADAPATYQLQ